MKPTSNWNEKNNMNAMTKEVEDYLKELITSGVPLTNNEMIEKLTDTFPADILCGYALQMMCKVADLQLLLLLLKQKL